MKMNKNYWLLASILFIVIVLVIVFLLFFKDTEDKQTTIEPLGDEEILVYLGETSADNEILVVFDYSCSWCKIWINDVFPVVEDWTKDRSVKFRTQSMVFLDQNSLTLSKLDRNLKEFYPKSYFDVFFDIVGDDYSEVDVSDRYVENIISKKELDKEKLLREPSMDVIGITRKYTKALDIESVPSVFVNGKKIEDSFDIAEIESYLN